MFKALVISSLLILSACSTTMTEKATESYEQLVPKDKQKAIILIVDMTKPSDKKRMYLYNTTTHMILQSYNVAHGKGSNSSNNRALADKFSNTEGSAQSSLGGMLTSGIYKGKHGDSIRLIGLEKGLNDNVYRRSIVIHTAWYASDSFIKIHKYAGNSLGCLAVSADTMKELLEFVPKDYFIYVYY